MSRHDIHAEQREGMLRDIIMEYKYTCGLTGKPYPNPRVMDAMTRVPRHEFVPKLWRFNAYDNGPLPICHDQTISQPYIVALMTDLLEVDEDDVILEIGTGSGYQAAILALLVKQVYTLEIIPELAIEARKRLARLGYDNVEVIESDGHLGLAEHAPFAGIITTAAADEIPPILVEQLAPGGNLVIPLGMPGRIQELMVIAKGGKGKLTISKILNVSFVPLTGGVVVE